MKREEINQQVRAAISDYVATYGETIPLSDLRGYVRDKAGVDYSASTLARMLRGMGYVSLGKRSIDSCPGVTTFYAKLTTFQRMEAAARAATQRKEEA
jgi:hypothetical protein